METKKVPIISRADYLARRHTHAEYYSQFITPNITRIVATRIGLKRLKLSTDEHLNDIPLSRWDAIGFAIIPDIRDALKQAGDCDSMSGRVCILKAAARMLLMAESKAAQ